MRLNINFYTFSNQIDQKKNHERTKLRLPNIRIIFHTNETDEILTINQHLLALKSKLTNTVNSFIN